MNKRGRDGLAGLGFELHVVHDGAVLDEGPPGVEGDDAARAPLVVLVLDVLLRRLRQVLVENQVRGFGNRFLGRSCCDRLRNFLLQKPLLENLRFVVLLRRGQLDQIGATEVNIFQPLLAQKHIFNIRQSWEKTPSSTSDPNF